MKQRIVLAYMRAGIFKLALSRLYSYMRAGIVKALFLHEGWHCQGFIPT